MTVKAGQVSTSRNRSRALLVTEIGPAGREGTAEVGPDGRLFITFDDGRPGFAHSDEVTVVDGAPPVTG